MRNLGTGELFIVVTVLFVLFGGKKLPELARGLGEAGKEFNKAFKGGSEPVKKDPPKIVPEQNPKAEENNEENKEKLE
jgi:sec-independent protein translocase protein TatA